MWRVTVTGQGMQVLEAFLWLAQEIQRQNGRMKLFLQAEGLVRRPFLSF